MPSERQEHEEIIPEEKAIDPSSNAIYETSVLGSESSFLPSQAAFASTPATARHGSVQDSFATQNSDDPSWKASVESPLIRLNREIANFSVHPDQSLLAPLPTQTQQGQNSLTSHAETSNILQSAKGKGKGRDTSNSIYPNYPINKNLNPYLPPGVSPAKWNKIVKADSSVLTPQRFRRSAFNRPTTPAKVDDDDDSFIGLPPGMSPPVTMSAARPPRSSAELGLLKVGQTPTKEASARIKRDLLRDAQLRSTSRMFNFDGGDSKSSMSTLPTPPSFSRYTRHFDYSTSRSITEDSSLESMIRHLRSDVQRPTPGVPTTPALRLRPRVQAPSIVEPTPRNATSGPVTPVYENMRQDIDSDSDSLDEVNDTAHPSAAFLMASQGSHPSDDSFGSSNHSGDSLTDEDIGAGLVPVHPFANAVEDDGFDDDDSFDDGFRRAGDKFQEETVFGVAPGERERIHAEGLRMMGQELLEDTIEMEARSAPRAGGSPTPGI